jgi:hypothetical protein
VGCLFALSLSFRNHSIPLFLANTIPLGIYSPRFSVLSHLSKNMFLSAWFTRRVGGISLISLVALCAWVLSSEASYINVTSKPEVFHLFRGRCWWRNSLTLIFAYYSLFIHILVTIFPFRACYALWDVTCNLKNVSRTKKTLRKRTTFFENLRQLSSTSLVSEDTLVATGESSPSSACSDVENIESGYYADVELDIPKNIHTILIPNYKEDMHVLKDTLDVLACHPQARSQYDVSSFSFMFTGAAHCLT